jgi:site-specific DNA-methyltransferase (adenine-specific)
MVKIKTIKELLLQIEKYKSAKDIIETLDINIIDGDKINKSKQGFIYERLWDICIKFGLFEKEKVLHIDNNINELIILETSLFKEFKDFFDNYLKSNIQSGKSGGYSDITFKTSDEIILSSAKYFENDNEKDIKDYDIQNLCPFLEKNREKNFKLLLFINNKEKFIIKRKKDNKSSLVLSKYINPTGNFENIFDLTDLELYFIKLKKILSYFNYLKTDDDLNNFKKSYLQNYKDVFIPKFHQSLFINQINKIINKNENDNKNILVGAIPRTGKTYILGGVIKKYLEEFKKSTNNFIILTPAPTETIPQYEELFNIYLDFNDFKIITKENIKNYKKENNNIFIFSKQKLDNTKKEENNIEILKKIDFDIIFIDEAHHGMTTDKSKELLLDIKKINTWKIFITATYNKPINEFSIPDKNKLFWSLENVIELKRISNIKDLLIVKEKFKEFYMEFIKKDKKQFNKKIIDKVLNDDYNIIISDDKLDNINNIINQYKDFPEPYLITTIWKNIDDIYNEIRVSNGLDKITFTMDSLFDLTPNNKQFINEEYLTELFHYYYGYSRKKLNDENDNNLPVDYNDRIKYEKYGIIPRIYNICENNCRTLQQSLNDIKTTTQLWFLPTNTNKLSNKIPLLLKLLNEKFNYIFNQTLFLVAISEKIEKNKYNKDNIIYDIQRKEDIEREEKIHKNKYKNIIILTGEKFTLGISLKNVDIVTLFNNSNSSDVLYQMMFRSMTEVTDNNNCSPNSYCHKKKYGFIVDLNPQRTIMLINFFKNNIIKKNKEDYDELTKKIKTLDLLNIDKDFYKSKFDDDNQTTDENKEYAISFFKKMAVINDIRSKNILNELKEFKIDLDINFLFSLHKFLKNFKIDKNASKILIYNIGLDVKFKKIIKSENPDKTEEDIEKEIYDDITKIYILLSEIIPILSIITDMNTKCVFDIENKDTFKKELLYNLNIIKENDDLKNIFIEFINDRCKLSELTTFDEYYNFFIELIKNININKKKNSSSSSSSPKDKKESSSSSPKDKKVSSSSSPKDKKESSSSSPKDKKESSSSSPKDKKESSSSSPKDKKESSSSSPKDKKINKYSDSICLEWKKNKLINPMTKRKITEGKGVYNAFKKNCSHIKTPILKTGGSNELINKLETIVGDIKSSLHNIDNPKDLLLFLHKNLKPTEKKKKNNSEVFTPIELIEEIMNKFTDVTSGIWDNPNLKWLDPAAGIGNFPVVVYLKLMNSLSKKIPNIEERRRWILEEMLYMVEYDKTNVFLMKKIFCGNKYKLNIFSGSYIEADRYRKEKIDILSLKEETLEKQENKVFCRKINKFKGKFDIIMGNPPFNDERQSPIYNKFIEKSLELTSKYLLFIVPSRWFSGGKGLDNFRKMMLNRKDIMFIKHFEKASNLFGNNVEINGGINYFLINKNYNGLCDFNNSMINLNKYDILVINNDYYSIIDKLIKYSSIEVLYYSIGHFGIQTNDKRLLNKKINNNYIICYVSQQKGNIKYIDKNYINTDITKWKIITPAAYGASKYFGNIFIGKPNEVYSQSFISFEVNNEIEAKSLLSYLKTKLANFMLSLRKNTQHISKETIKWIPLPPLDREWTNEKVFKYFKLTLEEIELIKI